MAVGKVIGKIEVSSIGKVVIIGVDGAKRDATYDGLMYEGEQLVSNDPETLFQIKYLALPESTVYEGVFGVLGDGSVIANVSELETLFGDDIDFIDTAAGGRELEANSGIPEDLGIYKTTADVQDFYRGENGELGDGITASGVGENETDQTPPKITSSNVVVFDENSTDSVMQITADDTSALSFKLEDGLDGDLFSIDSATGVITFNSSPNYEDPQDVGGDNEYNFYVTVTDVFGNYTTQLVSVNVNNVNEAPMAYDDVAGTGLTDVAENPTNGSAVKAVLDVEEGETVTFEWNFSTEDYDPYNDFAYMMVDGAQIQLLSNVSIVGDYGSTGVQTFSYTFTNEGTHTISFGVSNYSDTSVQSSLVVNYISGGTIIGTPSTIGNVAVGSDAWSLSTYNGVDSTSLELFLDPYIYENGVALIDVLYNDTDVDAGDNPSNFILVSLEDDANPAFSIVDNKIAFTPGEDFDYLAAGESVELEVGYTMSDDEGLESSATLSIIVTGTNDRPVLTEAITDYVNEDGGNFLGSGIFGTSMTNLFTYVEDLDTTDTQSIGEVYDYATQTWIGSDPSDWNNFLGINFLEFETKEGAIVRLGEDGNYWYFSNGAFEELRTDATGLDEFMFRIVDDSGTDTAMSADSVVTIIVDGMNDRPIAWSVTDTVAEGTLLTYDGAENARYVGEFNYSDVDVGDTHTSNLHNIEISGGYIDWDNGFPPSWVPAEYAQMKITGNATDIINIEDTYINTLPNGEFEIINPHFNNLGVDDSVTITFKYSITDDSGDLNDTSFKDTVSITITGTNDAPVVNEIAHGVTNEDAVAFDIALLNPAFVSDVDTHDDLDVTNVTAVVSDGVAPVGGVVFSVDSETGLFTIDPNQFTYLAVGEHVDLLITYDVDDGTVLVQNTATVTIEGRNDIPVVSEINLHMTEDSAVAVVNLLDEEHATDVDATDVLSIVEDSISVYVNDGSAPDFNLPNDGIAFSMNYETGKFTIDPAQFNYLQELSGSNQAGFVKIFVDFEVTDSNGGTVSNRAALIIDGVNDVPVISVENYTTGIDTTNMVNEQETNKLTFDEYGDVASMELQYFDRDGFQATSSDSAHITVDGVVLNVDNNANYNDAFSFFLNDGEAVQISGDTDIDVTMYRYINTTTVVEVNPEDVQASGYYIIRVAQSDAPRVNYDLDIKIVGIASANMPTFDNTTAEIEQNYMILDAAGDILDNVINPQEISREGFSFLDANTISNVITGTFGPSQNGENWNDAFKFSLTDGESANLNFVDNQTGDSVLTIYQFNEMSRVWEEVSQADGKGDYIVRVVSAIPSIGGAYELQLEVDASEVNYTDVGYLKEDTSEVNASGHLRIEDPDMGEDFFKTTTDEETTYGSFSIDANGNWTYTLNNEDPDTNGLAEGEQVTDTFEVWSIDESASHTITINIEGTNDAPVANVDSITKVVDSAILYGEPDLIDATRSNTNVVILSDGNYAIDDHNSVRVLWFNIPDFDHENAIDSYGVYNEGISFTFDHSMDSATINFGDVHPGADGVTPSDRIVVRLYDINGNYISGSSEVIVNQNIDEYTIDSNESFYTIKLFATNNGSPFLGTEFTISSVVATAEVDTILPFIIDDTMLLANDTDVDGDPLSISSVDGILYLEDTTIPVGSVSIDANGDIEVTPNQMYEFSSDMNNLARFEYTIDDGNGATDTATAYINLSTQEIVGDYVVGATDETTLIVTGTDTLDLSNVSNLDAVVLETGASIDQINATDVLGATDSDNTLIIRSFDGNAHDQVDIDSSFGNATIVTNDGQMYAEYSDGGATLLIEIDSPIDVV